jgi:hypothetical protein
LAEARKQIGEICPGTSTSGTSTGTVQSGRSKLITVNVHKIANNIVKPCCGAGVVKTEPYHDVALVPAPRSFLKCSGTGIDFEKITVSKTVFTVLSKIFLQTNSRN